MAANTNNNRVNKKNNRANTNNSRANSKIARFNHIKACMAAGKYWGIKGLSHKQITDCLDLICDHLAQLAKLPTREKLLKALTSTCWHIVIAKGYGTADPSMCRLTRKDAGILINTMEKAVGSSGFSITPDDIFECDDHPTIKSFFDDLRGYYADIHTNNTVINCSPKMFSYNPGDRWDENVVDGVMAISEPALGKLTELSNSYIERKLSIKYKDKRPIWEYISPLNDLTHHIRRGDIIIARKGKDKVKILGFGVVMSDYYYDTSTAGYKHRRMVEWVVWEGRNPLNIDSNVSYLLAGDGTPKIIPIGSRSLYSMLASRLGITSCQKALGTP